MLTQKEFFEKAGAGELHAVRCGRCGALAIPPREFCPECGTHVLTRTPNLPGAVLLKVGTFDDPSLFGGPQMVIFTIDKQSFHHVPEGVPTFERVPG